MTFAARLVAYSPGGARLSSLLLDAVDWDASFPHNDVAALSLSYPSVASVASELVDGPVEIAVEVSDGGSWVEPRNARFLSSEVQSNDAQPLDVPKFTFRGLGALVERPMVLRKQDNPGKPYDSDDKRNFLSATAGQIVLSVVQESRAKYSKMLDGIEFGFTASTDSLGKAWNKLDSLAFEPGTDLLRILDDATARGICDWWMQGRTLHVVNADSAAVTRSLRLNLVEATEAPVRATFEGMATRVALEGAEGRYWEKTIPGASVPYGDKILRSASDAISTEGTALDLLARNAVQAGQPRREYTRAIAVIDSAPLLDWQVGDWLQIKTRNTWESVRVFEAGLSFKASDAVISARVTLNDRFVDASVRDAKRLRGIAHGTTQNLGSGGIPSRADRAVPAAPKGVAANSLGYWLDAIPFSSVDVSWQAVTADTGGLALNGVDYYEVSCGGQRKRTSSTTIGFDGLQPSRIHTVTVYAVSSTGIRGKTSSVEVLTAYPLVKLDPPTTPSIVTGLGSIQVVWDGKLKGSGAAYTPPLHFAYILVETRLISVAGKPWVRWPRDHGLVQTGLTAGDKYEVRLVAVDMLGKESDPSPVATVTVQSEVQNALDHANQVAEDLLAEKGRVNAELAPVKGDLAVLKTETLPALTTTLNARATEIDTLKNTTIPALRADLTASEGKVNTLQNTTIPNLQTALTNVEGAAQSADKRSTVSTAAPSATTGFPQNAAWQRIDASGAVIGSWRLSGSSWAQMPLDPVVIPNLSAGIITSGILNTNRLNASEVAAAAGSFLSLSAGQITSGTIDTGRLNAQSVAAAVGSFLSLNASAITAGTINTDRLDAQTIAARVAEFLSIKTGQITWDNAAGNLAFIGSLVGNQAFVDKMVTDQLLVTPGNLMADKTLGNLWTTTGTGSTLVVPAQGVGRFDGPALSVAYTAATQYQFFYGSGISAMRKYRIPVSGDLRPLVVTFWARVAGTAAGGTIRVARQEWDADETRTATTVGQTHEVVSYWRRFTTVVELTSTARWAGIGFTIGPGEGNLLVSDVRIERQTGAVLVEDGAVTAPKIFAGAVTADKFAVGALDAFQITSPLIQSVSAANRGIKWNGNSFVAYNNSGVEMLRLEGDTGAITGVTITGGTVRTAVSGQRIQMVESGDLYAYSSDNAEVLRLQTSNASGGSSYFYGPTNAGYRSYLRLGVGTIDGTTTPQAWLGFNGGDRASSIWVHGNGGFNLGGTRGRVALDNSSGELRLTAGSDTNLIGLYNLPTTTTTGQPITTILGGNLRSLYRNTSLRKYKLDVADLSADDPYRVLKLQPRDWYDRTAMNQVADGMEAEYLRAQGEEVPERLALREAMPLPHRVPGFVAEEVVEVIPELASWDGDGNLSGVAYDRVAAYLLVAVKAMKTEIDQLRTQLETER